MTRLMTFKESGMSPYAYKEYVMTHARSELEKASAIGSMLRTLELRRRRLSTTQH